MNIFTIGFIPFRLIDILDIGLFTVVFYRIFIMIKDTRAITMFLGLVTVVICGFFIDLFNLTIVSWIFDSVGTVFWLAFFVIFQPEFRRILMQLGQNRILRTLLKIESKTVIDEIVKSAFLLSDKRIGGLFVLQKNVGLKHVIETGTSLKAEVTSELLVTIFYPGTPLHDGAVIIVNDMLIAAQCILPISQKHDLESKYGTRHRAALGMSEESDAVIIVISEETGDISIAYNGKLLRIESEIILKKRILRLFNQKKSVGSLAGRQVTSI